MYQQVRRFFFALGVAARRYGNKRLARMAAAISYRGIFALTPMMLIAVWAFALVVGDSQEAQDDIIEAIHDLIGPHIALAVESLLSSTSDITHVAAVFGAVLLFWTTSSLFLEIQNDLNDIFDVPYEHTSGVIAFLGKRGRGVLWTVGVAVLAFAVWALNLVWVLFENFFDERGLGFLHDFVHALTPLVTLAVLPLLFNAVVRTLTHTSINRAALWVGSFFTTVIYLGAAFGLRTYFSWDADTSAEQVAGAFFIVLLAAYVMSSVFLLGATVTRIYHDYYEMGTLEDPPPIFASIARMVSEFFDRDGPPSSVD